MNRLTKVYKNGKVTLDASAFPGELQETLDSDVRTAGKPIRAAVERLAELEDAEEKGLLVHLPCKVGDAVYGIEYNIDIGQMYIKEWQVESIEINEIGDIHMDLIDILGERYYNESAYDFGTHYFLTREEAEQALKAGESNNE